MKRVEIDPKKHGVGKTVVVVEDNATIRTMVAQAFLSDGFKTCGEADNGKEGIEAAKKLQPDLITMDLSMPVMNGLQAASALRKLFPKTPIILFTMFAGDGVKEAAFEAGIDLVLSKTEPLSALLDHAHSLIGG
jgi:two-component system, chemotaxis family, chemotaxis protein CheY